MVIELGAEDHVTDFDDINFTQQHTGSIGDRQHTVTRSGNVMDHLPQLHIRVNSLEVAVDDRVEAHQCQHGMVGVVGLKLTLLGQSEAIDAMRLEDVDRQIAVVSRSLRKGWADFFELPEGDWKQNISEATRETVLAIRENSDITKDTQRVQEKTRQYEKLMNKAKKSKTPLEEYKSFPQNDYDFDALEQAIVQNVKNGA